MLLSLHMPVDRSETRPQPEAGAVCSGIAALARRDIGALARSVPDVAVKPKKASRKAIVERAQRGMLVAIAPHQAQPDLIQTSERDLCSSIACIIGADDNAG
jgi:hypothetical protein